jgi:ABC-type lipoprotein release transport system permease subunit
MKAAFILLLKIGGAVLGISLGLVVAVTLTISAVLFLILFLQAIGLMRRVPLGYNFRNLLVRWRITLLTATAFTLVIALMTVMLAFVNGMYALTSGSGIPANVMVLSDGATDELFSNLGSGGDINQLETLSFVERREVRYGDKVEKEVPLVSWELYQVINQEIPNAKVGGRMRRFLQVRGVDDPIVSSLVHDLNLYEGGKWFDPVKGVEEAGGKLFVQAVLGEGIARELGPDVGKPALQRGDTFELGPERWIVVGILRSAGKTYDSEIWAKRGTMVDLFKKNQRTTAVIRVKDPARAKEHADFLSQQFKNPAVVAKTEPEYFESLNTMNAVFLNAILFVAAFMAIGGIFGVMNTMFAAIAQRTRDIGVMRILGFARWQILVSFFLESVILALLGGVVGCALGSLCHGWTATSILAGAMGGGKSVVLKLVVDWRILAAGMGFALLMGCIGGLLPALSAMRQRPLEALRG